MELVRSYSKAVHVICFWHGFIFAKVQYNHQGTNQHHRHCSLWWREHKKCSSTYNGSAKPHSRESFAVSQRYYYKEENWAQSKVSCTIVSQLQCITAKSRPASIEHLPRWPVRNRFQPILFTAKVLSFFLTEKSPTPSSPASPFTTTKRVLSTVDPLLQSKSPLPVLNDYVHQAVKVHLKEAGRPRPMTCLTRPQFLSTTNPDKLGHNNHSK